MYIVALPVLISIGVALLLTPMIRNLFRRNGWVDQPDSRKTHPTPVPRIGGVPIAVAYAVSMALFAVLPAHLSGLTRRELGEALRFLPAVSLIFLIGLFDDLFTLKASWKLTGELAASALAIWAGVQIRSAAGLAFPWWIAIPLTVVWLIGCSNAFNLIDGVDGLAAGAGLFATVTILIAGLLQRNLGLAVVTASLAGALAGFLLYNFDPASIFLGDSGSLMVGFLLGCFGIEWSQKSTTVLGMTAPLLAFAIPLLDTLIAMARRFLRGRSIFAPDRGHIHHKLLERGLSTRRVVLLLYAACGASAAMSLFLSASRDRIGGIIILIFCAGAWLGIQHLGYSEFRVAGRIAGGGTYRRLLNAHLRIQAVQQELSAASGIDQIWAVISRSYRAFGFHEVDLQFGEQMYSDRAVDGGLRAWTVRILIAHSSYLTLSHRTDSEIPPIVADYIDMLGSALRQKLRQLPQERRNAFERAGVAQLDRV